MSRQLVSVAASAGVISSPSVHSKTKLTAMHVQLQTPSCDVRCVGHMYMSASSSVLGVDNRGAPAKCCCRYCSRATDSAMLRADISGCDRDTGRHRGQQQHALDCSSGCACFEASVLQEPCWETNCAVTKTRRAHC